jgi:hypothetical protein
MSNELSTLNDALFDQLKRLNDTDLEDKSLAREIERSNAITKVSKEILNSGRLEVDAKKLALEYGVKDAKNTSVSKLITPANMPTAPLARIGGA